VLRHRKKLETKQYFSAKKLTKTENMAEAKGRAGRNTEKFCGKHTKHRMYHPAKGGNNGSSGKNKTSGGSLCPER
jgi:hypothetical protein